MDLWKPNLQLEYPAPLARTDIYSHALLLLVQLNKIVTTAHDQCALTRDACWKHNFCQFEQGVGDDNIPGGLWTGQ